MPFQIQVDGVDSEDLIEISGKNGKFYIAEIGSREELPGGRFYGDSNIQFFFYVKIVKTLNEKYLADVYAATTKRLEGETPVIDKAYKQVVMDNIKYFLFSRDLNFPEKLVSSTFTPSEVVFNWGIK